MPDQQYRIGFLHRLMLRDDWVGRMAAGLYGIGLVLAIGMAGAIALLILRCTTKVIDWTV
jgi:hypothetical protein